MKKIYCILMLLLFCCLSSGCGRDETAEYYDIQLESKPFYDVTEATDMRCYLLGAQIYQEEPVQFWAIQTVSDTQMADVFLYRMDGSRELLFEGLPVDACHSARCYMDSQGNLYHFYNLLLDSKAVLSKRDPSGKELYRLENEGTIQVRDICQLQDGRIFLNYSDYNESGYALGELDPDTGSISNVTSFVYDFTKWMGTGGEDLLCLDSDGIFAINIETGNQNAIWPFTGTTYHKPKDITLQLWDFMITEEGEVLLFWGPDHSGSGAFLETLRLVEYGKGKIPIVMRGAEFTGTDGGWFKDMAALFNQENEDYYIVLEECGLHADWDDYARQTSVETSAGKGPDIFYGNVLGEYTYGIAAKGGFVDLTPYLQKTGIKKEDYFPCTFECWKEGEKVYSVTTKIDFFLTGGGGYYIDTAVLGQAKEPDIETLVDALLSWQEKSVYMDSTDSQEILEMFLEGTENLWGMVDWEAGTCDFNNELFAKILEAAKQYGYDPRNNFPSLAERETYSLFSYMDSAILEQEGKTMAGTLFDDGYHAKTGMNYTLAINTNSTHKDGAWEFLLFLLGEEAQKASSDASTYSVNRTVFDTRMIQEQTLGREIVKRSTWGTTIITRGPYDLTDRRINELKEILEQAKFLPVKTTPILEIIYDEAQDYFDGIKSIDEICVLINNRVQLYLDEIR